MCLVPRNDLVSPPDEGATKGPDFWRVLGVFEIPAEPLDVINRQLRVGVGVDLTDLFFCLSRCCDFTESTRFS